MKILFLNGTARPRGNSKQLLETIAPEVAVISAGLGNSYGHPHSQTLERLAQAGAEIYRTDLQGTVSVRLGGGS